MEKCFKLQISSSVNLQNVDSVCAMSVYVNDQLSWLEQAIDSVLNQTLPVDLLVISVDGNVGEALSEYLRSLVQKELSVALFWFDENQGLAACMNSIIDWCSQYNPSYFFRMDADDYCDKERFEKQVAYLESNANIAVLGSWIREIDEENRTVGRRILPIEHEELVRRLPRKCPINHPSVVIRFSVFNDGVRYDSSLLNTQDYFLWIEIIRRGYKIANINEYLLYFRRVGDFYKRRGRNKSYNELKARFKAMRVLNAFTIKNIVYATLVFVLRMMPSRVIKYAYRFERWRSKKVRAS